MHLLNTIKFKVIGITVGGALFVDVTDAVVYPSTNTYYENVTVHYLTQDDSIDFTTGEVFFYSCLQTECLIVLLLTGKLMFADWKTPLKGQELYMNAEISNDILSAKNNREWASAAVKFFNNKLDDFVTHFSFEKKPMYEITFNRLSGAGYGGQLPSDPLLYVVSHENLMVSIKESL